MSEAERLARELTAIKRRAGDVIDSDDSDALHRAAAELRKLEAECEQLRADAARLAYLLKDDSEWGLCVFDHDAGYWVHDARAPDVVRADIDWAMKETK